MAGSSSKSSGSKSDQDVASDKSTPSEPKTLRGLFKKRQPTPPPENEVKKLREQLRDALTKMEAMKQQKESAKRQALEMSHVFRALQSITIEYDRIALEDDDSDSDDSSDVNEDSATAIMRPQRMAMKNIGAKVLAIRAHQQRLVHENKNLLEEKDAHAMTIETQAAMIKSLEARLKSSHRLVMATAQSNQNIVPKVMPTDNDSDNTNTNGDTDSSAVDDSKNASPTTISAPQVSQERDGTAPTSTLEVKFQMLGASQEFHNRQMELIRVTKDLKDDLLAKDNQIAFLESQLEDYRASEAKHAANKNKNLATPLPAIDEEDTESFNEAWGDSDFEDDLPLPNSQSVSPVHLNASEDGSVEISLMGGESVGNADMSCFTDDSTINSRRERTEPSMYRTRYHFDFGNKGEDEQEQKKKRSMKSIFAFGSKTSALKKRCEHLTLERDILLEDLEKLDGMIRDLEAEREALKKDNKLTTKDLDRTRDHYEKLVACHNDEKIKVKKLEKECDSTGRALADVTTECEDIRFNRDTILKELTELQGKHEDLELANQTEKQMTEEKLAKFEEELSKVNQKAFIAKAKQEQRSLNLRDVIYHYKQLQRKHKHILQKMEELEAEHCIALEKLDTAEEALAAAAKAAADNADTAQEDGNGENNDEQETDENGGDKEERTAAKASNSNKPKNQFLQQLQDDLSTTRAQKEKLEKSLKAREYEIRSFAKAKRDSERQLRSELENITRQMEKELEVAQTGARKAEEARISKEEDLVIVFKHMEQMSHEFEATKTRLQALESPSGTTTEGASASTAIDIADTAESTVDLTACTSDDDGDDPAITNKETRVVQALREAVTAKERYNRLNAEYEKSLAKLDAAERRVVAAQREAQEAKKNEDSRTGHMRDAVHRYKTLETKHSLTLAQMASLEEETEFAKREVRLAECKVKNTRQRLALMNANYNSLLKDHDASKERVKSLEDELTVVMELVDEYESAESSNSPDGMPRKVLMEDKEKLAKENVEMKAFCEEMLQLIED